MSPDPRPWNFSEYGKKNLYPGPCNLKCVQIWQKKLPDPRPCLIFLPYLDPRPYLLNVWGYGKEIARPTTLHLKCLQIWQNKSFQTQDPAWNVYRYGKKKWRTQNPAASMSPDMVEIFISPSYRIISGTDSVQRLSDILPFIIDIISIIPCLILWK